MLSKADRVRVIMEVTDGLEDQNLPWDRVNVILKTFGIEQFDPSAYDASLAETVSAATDEQLAEIGEFLGVATPQASAPAATTTTVRTSSPLFAFASHLAAQRRLVGQVGDQLAAFGVTLFVAHDSIADDAAWQHEIEKGLDTADVGIVFLHQGFSESKWCDQEVGWLLGRHIPVLPLNFGVTPYGPLGALQARPERSDDPAEIAERILVRITNQPAVQAGLSASLVSAMHLSPSYRQTDNIWKYLRQVSCDSNQCAELLAAVKNNDQVYGANSPHDDGRPYTRVIVEYIRAQTESSLIATDLDAYESFLDEKDREKKALRARLASPVPPGFASQPPKP
ncbi:toll/interleukin-1 receptor domain-containing protein [Williamsia muralis]|uniref:TIR domain-containing protein n=1 Tax=Williamsia marianensis TaxID=85044 RepID=A0A2G3PR93_WILMA|nr:toll/interleukin-1 receptor domain-containing protein [Williamsia marianensis]PHV68315.1 hypothetical protein CSW57_03505 [Williamsia marianensis]